jgi:large subunit ribosomal protein L7/L12
MEEQLSHIYRRLALLEQQVRVLSERVGVPCPTFASDVGTTGHGGVPAEVVALARGGNAIAAIKLYRELTGAGLREAKDVVDSLR